MNREQFSSLLADIQTAECEVREQAQSEYAHDDSNVFANFDRVASHLDISRERVLLTYALKHVDGIVSWVNGHKSQREDVRGRIKDLRMYMALLWGMVEDDERRELSVKRHDQTIRDNVARLKSEGRLNPKNTTARDDGIDDAYIDQPMTCECEDCRPISAHDNDSSAHVIITDQLTHNATKAFDAWWDAAGESVGRFTRSQALEAFQAGAEWRAKTLSAGINLLREETRQAEDSEAGLWDKISFLEGENARLLRLASESHAAQVLAEVNLREAVSTADKTETEETITVPIHEQEDDGPIIGYVNAKKSSWESNRGSMVLDGYILGKTEANAEAERRIEQAASDTKLRHVVVSIHWGGSAAGVELTCSCGYKERVTSCSSDSGRLYTGQQWDHK